MKLLGKTIAKLLLPCLLLTAGLRAATVVEQSGSTNPNVNGFVIPSIWTGVTSTGPVTNDLGLGINAWNLQGSWCCAGYEYTLSSADETALYNNNWLLTVDMRNLSTSAATHGWGPNSLGDGVFVGVNGLRFGIELHTDGNGNQVLASDPFSSTGTYTINGLGTNYAEIQLAYDASNHTAAYYVNGTEVLSGISGYSNFYEPWVAFGGEDANYSLIELQSDTSIVASTAPEPDSSLLVGAGALLLAGWTQRRRFSKR